MSLSPCRRCHTSFVFPSMPFLLRDFIVITLSSLNRDYAAVVKPSSPLRRRQIIVVVHSLSYRRRHDMVVIPSPSIQLDYPIVVIPWSCQRYYSLRDTVVVTPSLLYTCPDSVVPHAVTVTQSSSFQNCHLIVVMLSSSYQLRRSYGGIPPLSFHRRHCVVVTLLADLAKRVSKGADTGHSVCRIQPKQRTSQNDCRFLINVSSAIRCIA